MRNDLIGEGQLMVCQRALKGRELLIIPILNFFAELDFFFSWAASSINKHLFGFLVLSFLLTSEVMKIYISF